MIARGRAAAAAAAAAAVMVVAITVAVAVAGCGAAGAPAGGAAPPSAPLPRTVQLNEPGAPVDIEAHVVSGHVTVIDFWADYCGACVTVAGMLAVQTANEPRVLVRKVDVGDGLTPVARAYKIGALPHFRIYDKHRRLRHILVGNDTVGAAALARQLLDEP